MKVIETKYNGYKFRSRLEARWAVFFDACGIEYQYEPEGFELKEGYYLPDFYLPWFKCYVEIKPKDIAREDRLKAEKKLEALFFEHKSCVCMLCVGDPLDDDMNLLCTDYCDSNAGYCWRNNVQFMSGCWFRDSFGIDCSSGKHFIHLVVNSERYKEYGDVKYDIIYSIVGKGHITEYRTNFVKEKEIARQARFEHGECGLIG